MTYVSDDLLYEQDAIDVSVLIFGRRTCSACGLELAASTDYYAPDRVNASGLVCECRRCRRLLERTRYHGRRDRKVVSCGQLSML